MMIDAGAGVEGVPVGGGTGDGFWMRQGLWCPQYTSFCVWRRSVTVCVVFNILVFCVWAVKSGQSRPLALSVVY